MVLGRGETSLLQACALAMGCVAVVAAAEAAAAFLGPHELGARALVIALVVGVSTATAPRLRDGAGVALFGALVYVGFLVHRDGVLTGDASAWRYTAILIRVVNAHRGQLPRPRCNDRPVTATAFRAVGCGTWRGNDGRRQEGPAGEPARHAGLVAERPQRSGPAPRRTARPAARGEAALVVEGDVPDRRRLFLHARVSTGHRGPRGRRALADRHARAGAGHAARGATGLPPRRRRQPERRGLDRDAGQAAL